MTTNGRIADSLIFLDSLVFLIIVLKKVLAGIIQITTIDT